MNSGKEDPRKERGKKETPGKKLPENRQTEPSPALSPAVVGKPSLPADGRDSTNAQSSPPASDSREPEDWDVLGRRGASEPSQNLAKESDDASEEEVRSLGSGRSGKRRKKTQTGWAKSLRAVVFHRIRAYWVLALVALLLVFVASPVYLAGMSAGKKRADDQALRERLSIPPEIAAKIDDALLKLRAGDAITALTVLQAIEAEKGFYPSLSYLVALAAVQSGNVNLAETKITETIVKRERVSDALALQAVVESMKPADPTRAVMGDPKVRSENLLRQAILADPANAAPRFELATLLRYTDRRDEARKEIRAAQARLNPVDAHTVTEVTLALMDLEDLPDDLLPTPSSATPRNLAEVLVAANAALRRGDVSAAVPLLKAGRDMTSPDIFYYLTSDPVFRRYRDRPELAEYLQ